jgi:pimeloyl-ACP methyl ester carboxylesterase
MLGGVMRSILKLGKYLVLVLVVGVAAVAALFLSLRAYRQHANAKSFVISSPHGIDESGYVRLGGIDQWVQIRGQNRDNPVLLCVHGGPGGTWLPVTRLFLPWEKDFTVVFWDQRGAGKTLKSTGAAIASTMTIDRMVQDGIELAEHLRSRLGKEKIVLLGHSFGSVLGIQMAKRRPDLFYAFVGTGQVSDLPQSIAREYAQLQDQARRANDQPTLRALATMGPPPFKNLSQVSSFFDLVGKYQPASDGAALDAMKGSLTSPPPDYSLRDEFNRFRGFMAVPPWSLYRELLGTKLADLGPDFEIPIFVIQGSEDPVTSASLAQEYFATLNAPHKEMIVLPGGGHFAVWSMAEAFRKELVLRVRPLALPAGVLDGVGAHLANATP